MIATNLFPSTIITNADSSQRSEFLHQILKSLDNLPSANNPDVFAINDQSGWGIDIVRQLIKFFTLKPVNHNSKVGIIYDAQNLEIAAQNALLKILEEPPANCYLILLVTNANNLITTIKSRCQIMQLPTATSNQTSLEIQPSANLINNFAIVDDILGRFSKPDIIVWLDNQMICAQQQLIIGKIGPEILTKIIKSRAMITANVDPRSALDWLYLS